MIERKIFTSEHEMFRQSVRRFIEKEVVPAHASWEELGVVPRDAWRKAGAAGLLCTGVPDEYGGGGANFLYGAIVIEELARAGATGPSFHLHSDIVAPYLLHYGTEELKQRWLPKMATGEAIGCVAMTEPSGGSDLRGMRTTAVRDGDDYVINGQKVFITNAQGADLVVLACKTATDDGGSKISLVLVETDRPGFKRGRRLEKIGCRATDLSELFFEDCRVPRSNLVGEEGRGFHQLMAELPRERLIQAVKATATSEAMIDWTVEYASNRSMFGQKLADFQNTQFRMAEIFAQVVTQRALVDHCLELDVEGRLDPALAAVAKMVTCELQGKVADECLQMFGGWGYMWEMPIARAYADARPARIAGGTTEVMKQIIARRLFTAK